MKSRAPDYDAWYSRTPSQAEGERDDDASSASTVTGGRVRWCTFRHCHRFPARLPSSSPCRCAAAFPMSA